MGHSWITMTLDRYGHLMPGDEEEAAGLPERYLEGKAPRGARSTCRGLASIGPRSSSQEGCRSGRTGQSRNPSLARDRLSSFAARVERTSSRTPCIRASLGEHTRVTSAPMVSLAIAGGEVSS